ncbi:MAG: ABC transporter permease [Candidatus Sericytochromatia bacterium]|nr:ABC transporter permease [Candidatus Tanganyikabacteria bacterium]
MTWGDQWQLVLEAIVRHRFRSLLTLLGIILGVGTLVALSSTVRSAEHYLARSLQQASGEDVFSLSRKWQEDPGTAAAPPLSRLDARALRATERLSGTTVLGRHVKRVRWGERFGQGITVVGTRPEALGFYRLELRRGRFLTPQDLDDRAQVAVVGAKAARGLAARQGPIRVGGWIRLDGHRYRVVGILARKPAVQGQSFFTWDGSVLVPETRFQEHFASIKDLREIVVRATQETLEARPLASLVHAARAIVTWRHGGVQNFKVTDPRENQSSVRLASAIGLGLEVVIASVCLLVGGMNLMNVLLFSTLQRTPEIALRRALGATRQDILVMFLGEAMLLAVLGAVVGVGGGLLVAGLGSWVLGQVLGSWTFSWPWTAVAAGVAAALATGAVFGARPALSAAGLDPAQALRREG